MDEVVNRLHEEMAKFATPMHLVEPITVEPVVVESVEQSVAVVLDLVGVQGLRGGGIRRSRARTSAESR